MNTLHRLGLSTTALLPQFRASWSQLVALFESPWFAYSLILLLQLKVIWGIWSYREVSIGDTSAYYTIAYHWFTSGEVIVAWSPAYTAFYGSFLFLNPDPVWATLAHRLVIVVGATVLVLAVLRQLLPPGLAWLCAAWWAALPIVFNTMYEVHLFALLPVLVVWLMLLTAQGSWRRAAAFATLAAAAALVRNELSVPTGVLAVFLAIREWKAARDASGNRRPGLLRAGIAYAVCLSVVAALVAGTYSRSYIKYPELSYTIQVKHTVNMAQVYSFGYQQRHPEWTANPWLDCFTLMQEHYGTPAPTLREMIAANPRAVLEHFAWNFSLAPSGFQLLIFNRTSGTINPDYDYDTLRRMNNPRVGYVTGCLMAIWVIGLATLWRNWKWWWSEWLNTRALGWIGMFAVATVVPLIVATQRPRPSYLFTFGVLLIAISGMCLYAIVVQLQLMHRLRQIAPILMVALVLFVPRYFTKAYAAEHPDTMSMTIQRLVAHRDEIMKGEATLLVPSQPIGMFVHPGIRFTKALDQYTRNKDLLASPETAPRGVLYEFPWLIENLKPGETIPEAFQRLVIDFVYLDEAAVAKIQSMRGHAGAGAFLDGVDTPGWHLIDGGNASGDRWRLYRREK